MDIDIYEFLLHCQRGNFNALKDVHDQIGEFVGDTTNNCDDNEFIVKYWATRKLLNHTGLQLALLCTEFTDYRGRKIPNLSSNKAKIVELLLSHGADPLHPTLIYNNGDKDVILLSEECAFSLAIIQAKKNKPKILADILNSLTITTVGSDIMTSLLLTRYDSLGNQTPLLAAITTQSSSDTRKSIKEKNQEAYNLLQAVNLLLKHGAKVDIPNDPNHARELLAGAVNIQTDDNCFDLIHLLVEHGAKANFGALEPAAKKGFCNILKFLLDTAMPADTALKAEMINYALISAVQHNQADVVRLLVEEYQADINYQRPGATVNDQRVRIGRDNPYFFNIREATTPLITAARMGNAPMVKYLIEQKADPTLTTGDNQKYHPLTAAARFGQHDVSKALTTVAKQKNISFKPNILSDAQRLTLTSENLYNQPEIPKRLKQRDTIVALLDAASEVKADDNDNSPSSSPTSVSALPHLLDMQEDFFTSRYRNIYQKYQYYECDLTLAALIKKGCRLEYEERHKTSVLFEAVNRGEMACIKLLVTPSQYLSRETIDSYINQPIYIKPNIEHTPLEIACDDSRPDIAELLLDAGANPFLNSKHLAIVLMLCTHHGLITIIRRLIELEKKLNSSSVNTEEDEEEKNSAAPASSSSSQPTAASSVKSLEETCQVSFVLPTTESLRRKEITTLLYQSIKQNNYQAMLLLMTMGANPMQQVDPEVHLNKKNHFKLALEKNDATALVLLCLDLNADLPKETIKKLVNNKKPWLIAGLQHCAYIVHCSALLWAKDSLLDILNVIIFYINYSVKTQSRKNKQKNKPLTFHPLVEIFTTKKTLVNGGFQNLSLDSGSLEIINRLTTFYNKLWRNNETFTQEKYNEWILKILATETNCDHEFNKPYIDIWHNRRDTDNKTNPDANTLEMSVLNKKVEERNQEPRQKSSGQEEEKQEPSQNSFDNYYDSKTKFFKSTHKRSTPNSIASTTSESLSTSTSPSPTPSDTSE